jgi:hypothetical protein
MPNDIFPLGANQPEYLGKLGGPGIVIVPEANAHDVAAVLAVLRFRAAASLRPLSNEGLPAAIISERALLVLIDRFGIKLHNVSRADGRAGLRAHL